MDPSIWLIFRQIRLQAISFPNSALYSFCQMSSHISTGLFKTSLRSLMRHAISSRVPPCAADADAVAGRDRHQGVFLRRRDPRREEEEGGHVQVRREILQKAQGQLLLVGQVHVSTSYSFVDIKHLFFFNSSSFAGASARD